MAGAAPAIYGYIVVRSINSRRQLGVAAERYVRRKIAFRLDSVKEQVARLI
jgi:hypothetical protein